MEKYYPAQHDYQVFWGEMHGHTNLSDARGPIDAYFVTARDVAKLDFCAISDHDHGGVGKPELWGEKWELTRQKVREYHEEHKFVTLLAYERDSYPWYCNLVIYYRGDEGKMVRGEVDGEITREELKQLLNREDVLVVPHTTSFYPSGTDFTKIPLDLMTPLIEVYSRWGTDEYFGNPNPVKIEARGGFWRDALEKGARMGCIAGSDDHATSPGLKTNVGRFTNLRYENPGITAVLAKELTREAVFEALKNRRCYGTNGARIMVDFRLNGHVMGSELRLERDQKRSLYIKVTGAGSLKRVSLVKNGQDYMAFNIDGWEQELEELIFEYEAERSVDYYYLRVEQMDGGMAWTSPIWIESVEKEG
jgi:hypothetical protein